MFPWVANARAVMQNETVGWVKSIHETRYGELLGIVMVGPHVTDLIEAGVVALDAEATVETVADGMAAHPTLSEAIKEAGLVALGRAIHLPNRSGRRRPPRGGGTKVPPRAPPSALGEACVGVPLGQASCPSAATIARPRRGCDARACYVLFLEV